MVFSGKHKFILNRVLKATLAVGLLLSTVHCQRDEDFIVGQTTDTFTQGFNPPYLEVLWVVDNRSPMHNAQSQIVSEATKFFNIIDGTAQHYRMGVVTTDMQFAQGQLQPPGTGFTLTEGYSQSASERSSVFSQLLQNTINVHTGYEGKGLEASIAALQGQFGSQPKIPLVVIYLSYTDDESLLPTGQTDAVAYFKQNLLTLKGGDASLVRVYAVNYKPLPAGVAANTAASVPYRCAQNYNNEIDISPASYEDRYFNLAQAFNGTSADLCALSGFASQLNLQGLTLQQLSTSFRLTQTPVVSTIRITISDASGHSLAVPSWTFDAASNQVVFATKPTQGTAIVIQYLPAGK